MLGYYVVGAKVSDGKVLLVDKRCETLEELGAVLHSRRSKEFVMQIYYGEQVKVADDLSGIIVGGSTLQFNKTIPEYVTTIGGKVNG